MKLTTTIFLLLCCFLGSAQEQNSNFRQKKVAVADSIQIDSVSINSNRFELRRKDATLIDSTFYVIDYAKALLVLKKTIDTDSIIISYQRYPEFLTRTYKQLDESIIVEDTKDLDKIYKLSQSNVTPSIYTF